jgi:cation:H+ antiporter
MILFIILGGAGIVFGSQLCVDSATEVALHFGMSERMIGLTIVAFGTSLPELITSVTAAIKKNADIAIGNVVGSNIFNIIFILGLTAVISPINYINEFIVDNIVALIAMLILFFCVIKTKKLGRVGGIIMLVSYIAYFVFFIVL